MLLAEIGEPQQLVERFRAAQARRDAPSARMPSSAVSLRLLPALYRAVSPPRSALRRSAPGQWRAPLPLDARAAECVSAAQRTPDRLSQTLYDLPRGAAAVHRDPDDWGRGVRREEQQNSGLAGPRHIWQSEAMATSPRKDLAAVLHSPRLGLVVVSCLLAVAALAWWLRGASTATPMLCTMEAYVDSRDGTGWGRDPSQGCRLTWSPSPSGTR